MYNIVIIGAGQLGSRHLQGVKKSNLPLSIWVVDPNESSLKIAKERYECIDGENKSVFFVKHIDKLPVRIDLAIISTSSKPRLIVIKQLLKHSIVSNMVLEKFLFPKLSDYDEARVLIEKNKINTWVNCPRRMMPIYKSLKSHMVSGPITMKYVNNNWGLCCNSIHFIDIFLYITGENLFNIDLSDIEKKIIPSKREGYIELCGTIKITTPHKNQLILSSLENYQGKHNVQIINDQKSYEIDEINGIIKDANNSTHFQMPFQSDLSGIMVEQILSDKKSDLTSFHESASYHYHFLEQIVKYYNIMTGSNDDSCPIT